MKWPDKHHDDSTFSEDCGMDHDAILWRVSPAISHSGTASVHFLEDTYDPIEHL